MTNKGRAVRKNFGKYGRLPPDQIGYLQTARFTVAVFENDLKGEPDEEEAYENDMPIIRTSIQFPGRRAPTTLNLTGLTSEELSALRSLFDHAFDKAEPICKELDRRAQEAHDNGDDSFTRLYRALPTLVIRERKPREHGTSVPSRPDTVVRVVPEDGPGIHGAEEHGSPVDHSGPPGVEAQDHSQEDQ